MYRKLLFDLDGTLTDPKEGICKSVQYALHAQGIEEPNLDKLEPFIGPPLKDSFMEFYHMSSEQAMEAVEKYRERFHVTGWQENILYPGIPEMLSKLRAAGYELAVASSKPTLFVEKILKYFQIDQYFSVVVGSEMDGTRVNKDEVIAEALRRLFHKKPVQLDEVIMIGDRRFDIQGAQQIGVTSIGVSYGYAPRGELRKAGADYIVRTVKQLENLLLSLQSRDTGSGKKQVTYNLHAVLDLLLPLLIYYMASNIILYFLNLGVQYIIERNGEQGILWVYQHADMLNVIDNAVAMLLGVLFLMRHFLQEALNHGQAVVVKKGRLLLNGIKEGAGSVRAQIPSYLLVALFGLSLSIVLNILADWVQTAAYSDTYQNIASAQYSVPLWLGILLYGLVSPLVEEIVFRGVLYQKCKKYMKVLPAILLSSLIFGLFHGNLVQGVYAFLMGAAMAGLYEFFQSFFAPLLFHAIANIGVFVITSQGLIQGTQMMVVNCIIFATILAICPFLLFRLQKH